MKSKFNPEIVDEICKYVRAGNNYDDAANLVGISEETFYNWQRPDGDAFHPEFVEALKKAKNECKARNIAYIQQAAEKTWQAAAWWLERRYSTEYAVRQIQDFGDIVDKDGKRKPLQLLVNAGQGFIPATLTLPTSSSGGVATDKSTIQGSHMASESTKNLHSNNRDVKASTS